MTKEAEIPPNTNSPVTLRVTIRINPSHLGPGQRLYLANHVSNYLLRLRGLLGLALATWLENDGLDPTVMDADILTEYDTGKMEKTTNG